MKGTFQEIIRNLNRFWEEQGCIINQGHDLEMGAGTFNPATFLRSLGPEPYYSAYVEPCRRPADGRYGENPNRVQHYFQYQVILKPNPVNLQELYLKSLEAIGFDLSKHDVRFVHDDWESPTLGAWGLGWEVWMDGMEVTQFTYFQSVGGIPCKPVTGELTYGLERLAMYLLSCDNIFDLPWNEQISYRDLYHRNEVEWSHYNFDEANTEMWFRHFDDYEREAKRLVEHDLPIPAYDFVMKASHAFNLLDARGVISVTERASYIFRVRDLASAVARAYVKSREEQGHPLLRLEHHFPGEVIPEQPAQASIDAAFNPSERQNCVIEIGSEELPATFVPIGMRNLKAGVEKILDKAGIAYEEVRCFGTPRRLAVSISSLAMGRAPTKSERRGPAKSRAYDEQGQIARAAEGFFKSIGVEAPDLNDLEAGNVPNVKIREVKGAEYLFATVEEPGQATAAILAEELPKLILNLDFPKSMRWADLDVCYARPLRWILALLGNKVIPFSVGGVQSGPYSYGHRQLKPGRFEVYHAHNYLETLREEKVMVSVEERKATIESQIEDIEKSLGARVVEKEAVLPQVLHLSEWPMLTVGTYKQDFLKLPKEVLSSEMVEHQKYFPIEDRDGNPANHFVITADNTPSEPIREGNAKVLSARLSDGAFLWEQDLKKSLPDLREKLKTVTFIKGLGSLYSKSERLVEHARSIQPAFSGVSSEDAQRAAELCKADLVSEMVFEFPELQGTMGRYYAEAQGEEATVAKAIEEHWMPVGEKAPLPESSLGCVLALADKLDNLLACFAAGQKPTSSSDPYALRRQVLGIIRILIQHRVKLDLPKILADCSRAFPEAQLPNREEVCQEIQDFITNRIRTVFQNYDLSKDEIEASLASGWSDIYDSFQKVRALHHFRESSDAFPLLLEVYKRAKGQIGDETEHPLHPEILEEDAEKELNRQLDTLEPTYQNALAQGNYDQAYELIAQLQPSLARLFDEVRILAEDGALRTNRIALLQRVFRLFGQLLDFGKLQGGRSLSKV